MVTIAQLWIPIVGGGLLAWVASGLIHMVVKYHNSDYRQLANEDEVAAALAAGSPEPGLYTIPHCADMSQMNDEAMQRKFTEGPVAFVTVFPKGLPKMGKLMGQQVAHFIVGFAIIGWCATLALQPGAEYMTVFQFVAVVGFLTFGWAQIPMSIWYGHLWSTTFKFLVDAAIYALLAAGLFAWLWPDVGA